MIPSLLIVNAPPAIKTVADVELFFRLIVVDCEINFHPDTRFAEYVHYDSGTPTFHPADCDKLDALMNQAFEVCEQAGVDVYGIGIELMYKVLGMAVHS